MGKFHEQLALNRRFRGSCFRVGEGLRCHGGCVIFSFDNLGYRRGYTLPEGLQPLLSTSTLRTFCPLT